jgi:hypothetical protein
MDNYYQSQVSMPYCQGPARQRGRGLLSGMLALRTALPLIQKYILPSAKRLGKSVLENALPEVLDVISGRTKIKSAVKRVASKTVKSQLGGGVTKKKATED